MKTHIFIADTDALKDTELFNKKLLTVSPERQCAIGKYRFEKDKRLSLGAGLLLNNALSLLNISDAAIEKNEYGKPYLVNCPGVYFNLSHSGSRAMCAVSGAETGCDVEIVSGEHMRVAERYFTAAERQYIAEGSDREQRFCRLWTLKESYIKAIGAGLSRRLDSFTVDITEDGAGLIDKGELYSFFEPRLNDGYSYACCVKGSFEAEPEVKIIDLSCLQQL